MLTKCNNFDFVSMKQLRIGMTLQHCDMKMENMLMGTQNVLHKRQMSTSRAFKVYLHLKLDQGRICGQMQDVSIGKGQLT